MQIIFISRCAGELEKVLDFGGLKQKFSSQAKVEILDSFFLPEDENKILSTLEENSCQGVVLAGESPLIFKQNPYAANLIKEIEARGVNYNHISFANLLHQVVRVHPDDKKSIQAKAEAFIQVALEKNKLSRAIKRKAVSPFRRVLIINFSVASLSVAANLVEKGWHVYILGEENPDLLPKFFIPLYASLKRSKLVEWLGEKKIEKLTGYAGNFDVRLEDSEISVGGIVFYQRKDRAHLEEFRRFLSVDVDEKGYILPLHPLNPAIINEEGIFLINEGKDLEQEIYLADSASLWLLTFLDSDEIYHEVTISNVDEEVCGGCGTCVKTCIYGASRLNLLTKRSYVDELVCKGCGNCVSSCPTGARDLLSYPTNYLFRAIDVLSELKFEPPKILILVCDGCGYKSFDLAASRKITYSPSLIPLPIHCGGRVDTQLLLYALVKGFDGLLVCQCQENQCRNIVGNLDFERRANLFREILRSRKIDPERLRIIGISSCVAGECVALSNEFRDYLKNKGGLKVG